MKQWFYICRLLLMGLLALALSACLCGGNGDPYCGTKGRPPIGYNLPNGTTYYLFEKDYTCQLPSGEAISSYRQSIKIIDGNYYLSGDRCTPTSLRIPLEEITRMPGGSYLIYEGDLYSSNDLSELNVTLACHNITQYALVVESPQGLLLEVGDNRSKAQLPVVVSSAGGVDAYQGANVTLEVSSAVEGMLSGEKNGASFSVSLQCLIFK